jgi:hypothetical protein
LLSGIERLEFIFIVEQIIFLAEKWGEEFNKRSTNHVFALAVLCGLYMTQVPIQID